MLPEPLPETGVLTNQIADFVDGRRTLWLFNVDVIIVQRKTRLHPKEPTTITTHHSQPPHNLL